MLSCKEVVKNVSSEKPSPWWEKLEVRLHLIMCHHCGKYAKQLEMLRSGFRKLIESKISSTDKKKIQDVEDRVLEKIKK